MAKINFDNKAKICFVAKYDTEDKFHSKIIEYSKNSDCDIIELRIDTIYKQEQNLDKLIGIINWSHDILKKNNKYSLVTFRTKIDGGDVDLSQNEYYNIITKVYKNTSIDAIDIEYRYYIKAASQFDELLLGEKTIVLSFHEFIEMYDRQKINNLLTEMIKTGKDVIKIAIFTHTKKEVFELLEEAKKIEKKSQNNIFFVIIAMGKMGLVSRVYNEYTNTKIVYIDNDTEDIGSIGNINIKKYYKLRKKIKELI